MSSSVLLVSRLAEQGFSATTVRPDEVRSIYFNQVQTGTVGAGLHQLIIDGDVESWKVAAASARDLRMLRDMVRCVPGLVIGVERGTQDREARAIALQLTDLVQFVDLNQSRDERAAELERWSSEFWEAPEAISVLAGMLRSPTDDIMQGLYLESMAYTLLQGGPMFKDWLAAQEPRSVAGPPGRVRAIRRGDRVEVTLDRPERRNALNSRMRDLLWEQLEMVRYVPELEVVLQGTGPSFCAGGDLGEFGTAPDNVRAHFVRTQRSLPATLAAVASRVTVVLHGACVGAGIELAAFARKVVAASDTQIRLPEARMGLIPGSGGTVSLQRRIGRHRLVELVMSGDWINAETALRWGLVDEVVDVSELDEYVRRLVP